MKQNQTKTNLDVQAMHGHKNFMAGISYDVTNPIVKLKIVASSCFFGEPKYYGESVADTRALRSKTSVKNVKHTEYLNKVLGNLISFKEQENTNQVTIIESCIDEALKFDAQATLALACCLRQEDNIRTTPQVIMVRAANHPNVRGTGLLSKYGHLILSRTDDAVEQLAYQLNVYGKPIPNGLKKAWKKFLETKTEYDLAKYKLETRQFKLVDLVNMCHAYSAEINKLMNGELKLSAQDTWEALISEKGSSKETWTKAVDLMGHMALLRNLRNLHQSGVDPQAYVQKLVNTAKNGRQLPFRYYSAYTQLKQAGGTPVVLDAVETCLNESIGALPQFSGRVMSLCDNSGSAQGTATSSMGTMKVSTIANLTAILTGKAAQEGYIGIFGDKLEVRPVRKNSSVFDELDHAETVAKTIGGGTENGIWLFFDKAIREKEHWDHIFVYSDMQAGHGGLYGVRSSEYKDYLWQGGRYIDVAKLISVYRQKVNPNVKVYLVQVAGYADTLAPEFYDKTYILGGWGDGILKFAHYLSNFDESSQVKSFDNLQKKELNTSSGSTTVKSRVKTR